MQFVSARGAILREIISNSLAHCDYSCGYVAKMKIEKDRIFAENSNRTHGYGNLNLTTFEPFPKNPAISKVFREIGPADELGSGFRVNLYRPSYNEVHQSSPKSSLKNLNATQQKIASRKKKGGEQK